MPQRCVIEHSRPGEFLGDSWLYDLADGAWRPAVGSSSAAPAARGWFNTVATGANTAAIFGGFDGVERRSDVHVFEL